LRVEEAKTEGDTKAGDNPEAQNDCYFSPAHEFEVMLKRSHLEESFAASNPKEENLQNN
jgi:hypothetical protein